ncbi:MAG: hypothetical protein LQ349_008627 [Xanthoria aureola]|nr:MAG: hypothetical protein LQ349_008627 [Xanthoria aureola]
MPAPSSSSRSTRSGSTSHRQTASKTYQPMSEIPEYEITEYKSKATIPHGSTRLSGYENQQLVPYGSTRNDTTRTPSKTMVRFDTGTKKGSESHDSKTIRRSHEPSSSSRSSHREPSRYDSTLIPRDQDKTIRRHDPTLTHDKTVRRQDPPTAHRSSSTTTSTKTSSKTHELERRVHELEAEKTRNLERQVEKLGDQVAQMQMDRARDSSRRAGSSVVVVGARRSPLLYCDCPECLYGTGIDCRFY